MLKKWFLPIFALLVLAALGIVGWRWQQSKQPYRVEEAVPVQHYALQNGLQLVVIPNHRIPAVTQMLWVKAGAADDPANMPGLAHFLEHMQFTGTDAYPEGKFDAAVERMGGSHNAFTSYDFTAFYITAASEHLETLMALQADQLKNTKYTDVKAAREIKIVQEERKMRVDNRPSALLREQMQALQFLSHPYRRPAIGWANVIANYTTVAAQNFYKKYYRAANMVLVVAGDVDPEQVRSLAGKYFGDLSAGKPVARDWMPEQPLASERSVRLRHPAATQTQIAQFITVPSLGDSSDKKLLYALDIYTHLLGGDHTSLLYRRLVREQKLAISVSADLDNSHVGPGTLEISAIPAPGVTTRKLEKAIAKVLQEMRDNAPGKRDLARAKTQLAAEVMYAQDGLESLANIIGELYALGFDEQEFYRWQESIYEVKLRDIAAVAELVVNTPAVIGEVAPTLQEKIKSVGRDEIAH
jgi:zinc protease